MSDSLDQARDGIEHAQEAHIHHGDSLARWIAVLIAVLAAALAIGEMAEKQAQNTYLTHHITLSDDWAFYQAKRLRAAVLDSEATVLGSLPNAADPGLQARAAAARKEAARLLDDPKGGNGVKQLTARAAHQAELRDAAFERYHHLELVVGALQIAIVLASVSVVTRVRTLAFAGGALGAAAAIYGLMVGGAF